MEALTPILQLSQIVVAACALYVAASVRKIQQANLENATQNTYMKLYELIERHHSPEITELRKCANELSAKALEASSAGLTLSQYDDVYHKRIYSLINYYESLAVFLQYGWKNFSQETRTLMLDVFQNSSSRIWPLVEEHKCIIYGGEPPKDWVSSFRWWAKLCATRLAHHA